ncbi:MAG: DUF4190 domain-containing protein [Acidobacteria bacterium]|nr:DUF4190 domain-containing protein [Acidobacteriota bacterium]
MKRCPTCDKTFEDTLKFCQADGTPLVDESGGEPLDPYATMISAPVPKTDDAIKKEETVLEPAAPPAGDTQSSVAADSAAAISVPDDSLPPGSDPLKTMMVSEEEMRAAMSTDPSAEVSTPEPAPPSFIAPAGDDLAPPPSPFTEEDLIHESLPAAEAATQIYPTGDVQTPAAPAEPAPVVEEPAAAAPAAFNPPPSQPVQEWTPPPAPDAQWQNQQIGSNTPFQPPPAGVAGQSQGLAIGSMICGILSCLCCFSVITGPIAVVLGYLARKKIAEDPASYGGGGFALVGMITGILGFIIGVTLIILQIFFGVLSNIK